MVGRVLFHQRKVSIIVKDLRFSGLRVYNSFPRIRKTTSSPFDTQPLRQSHPSRYSLIYESYTLQASVDSPQKLMLYFLLCMALNAFVSNWLRLDCMEGKVLIELECEPSSGRGFFW